MTVDEAIERAVLYVLQLSDIDYIKIRPLLAAQIKFALKQDGFEVVPVGQGTLEEQIQREFG